MIEQQARVISVDESRVCFATEQAGGCSSCSAKGGCGTSLIAQLFPNRPEQMLVLPRAQCPASIEAGERWILAINEQHFGLMAVVLYLIPLLGLLLGAMVGHVLFAKELFVVFMGLSGLSGSLLWSRHQARRYEQRLRKAIVVLRKVEPHIEVSLHSSKILNGG